jgi:hypothetical protein
MTKYDGKCLHDAGPGKPGDCTRSRKEGSVLCPEHHALVVEGAEKAPPLRMVHDYVSPGPVGMLFFTDYEKERKP